MAWRGWYGRFALLGFSLAISACASINNPNSSDSESQALFSPRAIHSTNVALFSRWTKVADRFAAQTPAEMQACTDRSDTNCSGAKWSALIDDLKSRPLTDRITRVNDYFNEIPYVPAEKNWGDVGYWETPYEFLARGGQCQDYAIAKYFALKASGVPESDLRFVVVRDLQRRLDHAILIVAIEGQDYVLDNLNTTVEPLSDVRHYRAYYAINNTGWWAYLNPSVQIARTQIANSSFVQPSAQ